MRRKDVIRLIKRVIAIILVAVMTASVLTSYDRAGQFFNSVKTVFADEIEGEGEDDNSFIIDTEAPDTLETEPSYNEDCIDSDIFEDTTGSSESEPAEDEPENTGTFETDSTNEDIGLIQREVKAEGEDIFVSGLLPSDAKVTAERVEVEVSGVKVIAAYDIKVFDKDGNEWQPAEPLKISVASEEVNKAVEDETQVIYVPDDLAESGKPVDIKDSNVERIDAVVKDGNVEFQAGHFSVYVIIEHAGGEVVTPRVQFHFIAPVTEDYQPENINSLFVYSSSPYLFNNKAADPQATNKQNSMIVRDGDTLESIEAPMNTQSTYFYGWYTVDKSDDTTYNSSTNSYSGGVIKYSWPLNDPGRVELDKTVSVSAVRSGDTITAINWTVGNVSGTCTDVDSEGCAHVYLAPIYSNYYFVNFHLGAHTESTAETLLSRKLIVLGNSNQTEVKVSDVSAPSNDPVHIVFIGWEQNIGTEQDPDWELIRTIDTNNQAIIDPGKDGKYITVGAKTVDLYPYFVQARYINFNIGPSGNGALFLGPQLIFTSDKAEGSDMYALSSLPTTTRNGYSFEGWYTGADGTGHQITDYNGDIIDDNYVVNGSYMGTESVAYEVKGGKLYAYNALDEVTFYAKWVANTNTTYKVVIWKQKVTDAVDATEKTYDYETYYYDDEWNSGNPVTESVLRNFSGKNASGNAVTNTNLLGMTFEGFEFDRYDYVGAVDPQGSTVINIYYDRKAYTFTFRDHYQITTSNSGTQYGVVNNEYQQIYYRNNAWRLANNNNAEVYTGARCTYNANTWYNAKTITALSGQDISSYFPIVADSGFIYNSGERWNPQNGTTFNDVVVIIYQIPNESITFNWDFPNRPTKTMYYYVEVLPDDTPDITVNGIDYILYGNPVNANVNFFTREDFVELEGYTQNGSNPAFASNNHIENANSVNFYYTRNKYNLTFSANYPDAYKINEPEAQVISNIPYEKSLENYSNTPAPDVPSSDYVFDGWYEDAAGVKPFDFAHETMPSANKVIYAKWSLKEYQININPNGGVISSIDYSWFTTAQLNATGLDASEWNGYATYFDNLATQTIESYDNLNRNYVEVSDAEAAQMNSNDVYRYVYIYRSNLEGGQGKLGAQARTAVYIRDTEPSLQAFYEYYVHQVELRQSRDPDLTPLPRAQWEATYVSTEKYRELRSGEQYVFLAWYEVVNGVRQNTPYDFTQPAEHETTLIAEWRLDGGYSILYTTEYYADNNDYITANLEDWTDPLDGTSKYADGATTQAMQEPTSVTVNGKSSEDAEYVDYQFLGWQIVKVETVAGRPRYTPLEPGVYYTAGQNLTVRARYSDANMVIHMQAVYQRRDQAHRRPDVVNLTLDASKDAINAGTGSVDSTLVDSLPAWAWPGHYWADDTHIYFGDTQSNTAVHLYKYATTLTESEETNEPLTPPGVNVFKHSAGYKLIGFDLDSPDTDFVPDYPADAVIAVSPGDEHTLYAVWEPMVYLTVKNDTNVGPVTFTVSGTAQAIRVVNQSDGSFSRTALNPNQGITLATGESVRLVIPYGDGEKITISGTNTLGTGYWLNAKSELGLTSPTTRTLSGDYYRVPNTQTFSFTDEEALITHAEGVVITFTAEKAPHTLVLDDNYTGGATREVTFSETSSGVVFYQDESIPSFTLPSTSTRIGWELLGWDESPVATSPAYTTGVWTITNLTAFFTSNGSSTADLEVKTLYAIWKSNADASTVYVWKNVPEPGDQTKDYTFAVSFGGGFRYTESESYSSWFHTRYRWKSSQTTGTISTSTAYNNTATLTYDFTLKHNQYLKIVTEKNETNQNGVRPSLKMSVTKWQRSSDGSPDMQIGNVTELIWNWTNTITITNDPDKVGLYKDFSFQNLNLSVTEADYTSRYDLDVEVAAQTTNAGLTVNNQNRQLSWTDTFAGGTVIFTNTRKTADVTINKSLLPVTADPELFSFTAEVVSPANETITYTLDPSTYTILSGADAANGGVWKIEGIPTGSTLIVTENLTAADINRFETSASGIKNAVSGISPVTDTAPEDNIFSFVVEDNTTVTFTNTLRTQNIRLVVMDDSVPPEYLDSANFTFPGVFEGTKFSAAGTGLVWEGTVFVGEYDLTETSMPDHAGVRYTKLQATATVNVNSDGVVVTPGAASDTIRVLYNDINDVYTIIVVNPKMQRVTIKKTVENDYGINNSFLFTITVTDSNDQPIQLSNVHGTQGTNAQGKLEFTLVNNQTALLYVPRYANVRIDETVDDRYITAYQTGDSADSLGAAVIGTSTTLSNITSDKYVLCNNQRQLVNVSVAKTVVGNGDTFTFTAQIKENNTAVTNYTLSNNGTPGDTSDDIVTDSEGVATFTLTVADNGTAAITFMVHKGMAVNVTEGQGTTVKYNTVYSVVCADGFSKDGQGNSTGFVTANADTNISFTNTEASVVAPTAVKSESMNLVILMISSSTCLAGAVVHNERKKKGGQDVSTNDE